MVMIGFMRVSVLTELRNGERLQFIVIIVMGSLFPLPIGFSHDGELLVY
jgi:hypothetical protein